MSLFLDHRCEEGKEAEASATCIAWAETQRVLAVGYEDNRVSFYAEEGNSNPPRFCVAETATFKTPN